MFRDYSTGAYYREPPQREGEGWQSWITRGANFAIIYTRAMAGAAITGNFQDEHFAYALDGGVIVTARGEERRLGDEDLAIVPPGDWRIRFEKESSLLQMVTADEGIAALAANQALYADGAPEVAPIDPWPEPTNGYRLRHYSTLEGYRRGGLVHAYRTRKLMMVPYPRFLEPRDETQLSPHAHADFEQGSVALEGEWQHYLRVPWTANRREWKPDATVEIGSPSTTIIPAGVIHTSQGMAGAGMRLVDVFAPPRMDFSERGWVDNADEYPMPPIVAEA